MRLPVIPTLPATAKAFPPIVALLMATYPLLLTVVLPGKVVVPEKVGLALGA
jgi:hypothetical protein